MNPGGAAEMTTAVRDALARLLASTAAEAGAAPEDVLELVVVCNPVMHHLFLGIDPVELGWAPFALASSDAVEVAAEALGLGVHPGARVHLLPCIAGHVGADAAAVALSEAPHRSEDLVLVVDVGTNAEILLGDRRRVLACSSPTGPAFEGAQISSGQRAAAGAIERVRIDPATKACRFRVIGQEVWSDEPGFDASAVTGICGSGIIEAVAEMRLAGVVDADGVIGSADAVGSARCVADGRVWAYVLHEGEDRVVSVTQGDVRAIQLAKAALTAGARLLMDRMGVERVDREVLAGVFGAHISPLHALILGMIPDCSVEKVTSAGNAAGTGARIALLDRGARAEIAEVVRRIEKVETAVEPRFQEHFVEAMAIPHKTRGYPELSRVAALPEVRAALLELQRACRKPPGLIADGRDMGTIVFPGAELKVFLQASVEERAKRRYKQLKGKGENVILSRLFQDMQARDRRDRERAVAPTVPAADAVVVDSTRLSLDDVVERIVELASRRFDV